MPERVVMNKGAKEHLIVDVVDRLKNLASLDGAGSKYDIRKRRASNWIVQNQPANSIGLTAYCLVDTSLAGYDESGTYELFLSFDNFPESPRLGPFDFEVNF